MLGGVHIHKHILIKTHSASTHAENLHIQAHILAHEHCRHTHTHTLTHTLAHTWTHTLTREATVCVPCRWLDRKEDDGAIERDLFPSASIVGATHWKLTVVTGDESGAGTDANVFCMLRGDKGAFGPHQLTAQKVGG